MGQNQNQGGRHGGDGNEKPGQQRGGAQKPGQQAPKPGQNQQAGKSGEKKPSHDQYKGHSCC